MYYHVVLVHYYCSTSTLCFQPFTKPSPVCIEAQINKSLSPSSAGYVDSKTVKARPLTVNYFKLCSVLFSLSSRTF